jgi:hypothetical protein
VRPRVDLAAAPLEGFLQARHVFQYVELPLIREAQGRAEVVAVVRHALDVFDLGQTRAVRGPQLLAELFR